MMPPKEIKPWSVRHPTVEDANEPDHNKAKEVTPFGLYASLDLLTNASKQQNLVDFRARANTSLEVAEVAEAKASAEDDPKAVTSSAVDSASSSATDSRENGTPPTGQTQMPIHPSMLPENSEDPAPVEKDQNLRPPLFP